MKAFFSKIWAWIVSHKVIAIVVASVIVVGSASAIVLPIVLHEHSYSTEWTTDETNHWHDATCKHDDKKSDVGAHEFDNACDTTCNVCNYERTVGAHEYDNACDTACNVCDATRTITHDYATVWTMGETTHYYECSVCGDKKDETAHVYDKEVVSSIYLKDAATATTKAVYYKSCECGAKGTETFETDKLPANLQVSDISKTYDTTPVAEPEITFDGVGGEGFEYYKGDEKLTERPTDAGTYKVVVTVGETETHAADRVEKEFTIAKKVIEIPALTKVYDGSAEFEFVYTELGQEIDVLVVLKDAVNAGTYTDVAIANSSVSYAENYEITATKASATITPKTLNYLNLTKVYDGRMGYNDSVFFLGTEHGLIAGDVVSIETNDDVDYNVGTYKLSDTSGRWDLDDGIYLEGKDAGNYAFNYQADGCVATITVTKRAIWVANAVFTYKGENTFYGDESDTANIKFENVVSGDTINSCDIIFEFAKKDVSSNLVGVKFDTGTNGNYEFDFSKCSAKIVKRAVWAENVVFVYDGYTNFCGDEYPVFTLQNVVAGEKIDLGDVDFQFNGKDVGSKLVAVDISEEYNPNYTVDFAKCSAKIVAKTLENVTLNVAYNGVTWWTVENYAHADIEKNDEVIFEPATTEKVVGEYTTANGKLEEISLSGKDGINYVVDMATAKLIVAPKQLESIEIYYVYNGGIIPAFIAVTEEQGKAYGDELKVELYDWHAGEYEVGPVYKLTDKLTEAPAGEHYYVGASLIGADAANYTFTYNDDDCCGTLMITSYKVSFPYNKFNVTQKADGTNIIVYKDNVSNGYNLNKDYMVEVPLLDFEGNPITEFGTYTNENAELGNPTFYIKKGSAYEPTMNLAAPDNFYSDYPFEIVILDSRALYIQMWTPAGEQVDATGLMKYRGYLVQGSICVGDEISTRVFGAESISQTMTVAKLEMNDEEVDYVNGEGEIYFFVENGPGAISPRSNFVVTHSDTALTYSKVMFIKMQYTPDTLASGVTFTGTCSIRFVLDRMYAQYSSTAMANEVLGVGELAAGEEGYVKLLFSEAIYYAEGTEIYICPATQTSALRVIGTATIVSPEQAYKDEQNGGHMLVDGVDLVANQPMIIKLTNEFDNDIDRFAFSAGFAALNRVTNYTVTLYSATGVEVADVTYDADQHTFKYADTTEFKLAKGETCYIVIIPEKDAEDFLMMA